MELNETKEKVFKKIDNLVLKYNNWRNKKLSKNAIKELDSFINDYKLIFRR